MIYLVIAYRWGWLNGHQYIVHAGLDRDFALDAAEVEVDDRGGKYGVAVYSGEQQDLIDYHPSSWGEAMPTHNRRLDMFQTIGHAAHDWVMDGKAFLPNPESPGTLKYTTVEEPPPQWLIDRVNKEEDMAKFMTEIRDGKLKPLTAEWDFGK